MEPHQHTSGPAPLVSGSYWRRADRGRLRFTGRDALSFLQALVSNDVEALPIGGACDAVYLTPQGRMITDMRVFRRADDVIVSVPAELAAALAQRLDSLVFSEDVQIADVSQSTTHLTLIDETTNTQRDLVDEPPPPGARELSAEEFELRRIEAGAAKWGVDMNEDTIPLEAGLLDRAISQSKGCYVGQEIIIRVLHRGGGRVAKRLMKLVINGTEPLVAGTEILANGIQVGHVTSSAFSARANKVLALGYIKREHAEAGTPVEVGGRAAVLGAAAS